MVFDAQKANLWVIKEPQNDKKAIKTNKMPNILQKDSANLIEDLVE